MLKFKNFADVLEAAVRIERRGANFYNKFIFQTGNTTSKGRIFFPGSWRGKTCRCFQAGIGKSCRLYPSF